MDKEERTKKSQDGRGKRPKDPNQLAKWIVEQTTQGKDAIRLPKHRE